MIFYSIGPHALRDEGIRKITSNPTDILAIYLTSVAGEQRYERDFKQMEKPYKSNEGTGINTQLLFFVLGVNKPAF